jgi:hypothetical protein
MHKAKVHESVSYAFALLVVIRVYSRLLAYLEFEVPCYSR